MCSRRRNGCFATARMNTEEGATITMGTRHIHSHEPQPIIDNQRRAFFHNIRERGAAENLRAHEIFNNSAQQ